MHEHAPERTWYAGISIGRHATLASVLILFNIRAPPPVEISIQIREKRLSSRRAQKRSLLPLSPKRTQVRLKSLLYLVWLRQIHSEPTGVLRGKSAVCGLNGFLPRLARSRGTFHLNPRPLRALAPTAPFKSSALELK